MGLIRVFQRIQSHLLGLRRVSFNHVRRKANKLADIMDNQGVCCIEGEVLREWQELPQRRLKDLCLKQAKEDMDVFRNRTKARNE